MDFVKLKIMGTNAILTERGWSSESKETADTLNIIAPYYGIPDIQTGYYPDGFARSIELLSDSGIKYDVLEKSITQSKHGVVY